MPKYDFSFKNPYSDFCRSEQNFPYEPYTQLQYSEFQELEARIHSANPLGRYHATLQMAFRENFDRVEDLHIDERNPVEQIADMAFSVILVQGVFEENVQDWNSHEINKTGEEIYADLKDSVIFKVFFAASNQVLFYRFFPGFQRYFGLFNRGSKTICSALFRKFPCLLASRDIHAENETDLAHVWGILFKASFKNRRSLWLKAGEDFRVIHALIRQWKGTCETGLKLILNLAESFDQKYKKLDFLFKPNLLEVLSGYPDAAADPIEKWWTKNISQNLHLSAVAILEDFKNSVLGVLKAQSLIREKRRIFVSKSESDKITVMLKAEGCEDGFWEVHAGPLPTTDSRMTPRDSARNFTRNTSSRRSARTPLRAPRRPYASETASSHQESWHIKPCLIKHVPINDADFILSFDSDFSCTKRDFIVNTQATISVTRSKDHLVNVESFTGLSITDANGVKHRTHAKGQVLVNDQMFTCYWLPTFEANVISFEDLRNLTHHLVFDKYVFVTNEKSKIATPMGRLDEDKRFEFSPLRARGKSNS